MKELLLFLSVLVSCACVIIILVNLKISSNKRHKISTSCNIVSNAESTLSNLDIIIETCVVSINQKMVSTLKEINSFAQSDKEEAFNECQKMISTLTSNKTYEALNCLGIDSDGWIKARIEYFVRKHKST